MKKNDTNRVNREISCRENDKSVVQKPKLEVYVYETPQINIMGQKISSLRSLQVEMELKPSFSYVLGNRLARSRKIKFLRFEICSLAFEYHKGSTGN